MAPGQTTHVNRCNQLSGRFSQLGTQHLVETFRNARSLLTLRRHWPSRYLCLSAPHCSRWNCGVCWMRVPAQGTGRQEQVADACSHHSETVPSTVSEKCRSVQKKKPKPNKSGAQTLSRSRRMTNSPKNVRSGQTDHTDDVVVAHSLWNGCL